MQIQALRLKIGPFIPIDAEPSQPVENSFDQFRAIAFDVRVLDAQDHRAAGARANSQLNSAVRAPPTCK